MPKTYLPSPDEIRNRAKILTWMQDQKWNDSFITSVMIYDSPSIELVWKMVNRHGSKEARKKLMEFFE